MTQINWGIAAGPTAFDNALAKGVQMGQMVRQRQDEKEKRNALATYATNPSEEGLAGLAPHVPEFVIAERQRMAAAQQQQQAQQTQQRRADMPMVGRLLDHASQGPEQWQQALGMAKQYGIDLTSAGVPEAFDPQWAKSQSTMFKALQTDEGQEALSTIGKQAVDMGFKPGTPEFQAKVTEIWQQNGAIPYTALDGSTRLYIPGRNGVPAPQPISENTVIENDAGEKMILRGGKWQPHPEGGAGASRVGSNFLDGI